MANLGEHFKQFSVATIGHDATIDTPYGHLPVVYADWTASGRLYEPIEQKMLTDFGRLLANTHTESSACGEFMTQAYNEAKQIIKKHVGATDKDVLLAAGSGMTSAVVLLQRLLGWRIPEKYQKAMAIPEADRPVVFVSEMEHHSNHTTWIETIADVVVVPSTVDEPISLDALSKLLKEYSRRKFKVAAITAASNVTGTKLPVHDVAKLMHQNGGLCFVDYACAAPYIDINMHPKNPLQKLDAIYFSPHKFLGGPGTPGILVFDSALYNNAVPDRPGGGTVLWTNPWGGHRYFDDIEVREDGGTPPFLGVIKTALAVNLKEKMNTHKIAEREEQLVKQVFKDLDKVPGLSLLDSNRKDRLAIFSFTIDGLHYSLVTRLLSDRFGIQARAGCACAGTYGHCLFDISQPVSKKITDKIDCGDLSEKPGFTRVSLHPMTQSSSVNFITSAIKKIALNGGKWAKDYEYDTASNEFINRNHRPTPFPAEKLFQI